LFVIYDFNVAEQVSLNNQGLIQAPTATARW
jgi:hypothetical protein